MNIRKWRTLVATVLSLAILHGSLLPTAQAGVVDTSLLIQDSRAVHLSAVQAQLDREEVRGQLQRLGVTPQDIEGRLDVMSERELAQLAQHLEDTPAGGDGLLAAIGFAFVILIILELAGVINIFNRA